MRHRRHEGIAHHSAPISPHHKRGDRVGEEHQHQPLENVRYLVITEPNRSPRDQQGENHYNQCALTPDSISAASAMPARSAAMLIVLAESRAMTKTIVSHFGNR